jgi:hypothetical protein
MKEFVINALEKLKKVKKEHGREIMLFASVLVIGVVGFEIGLVEGQSMLSKPLVIEVSSKPVLSQSSENGVIQDGNKQAVTAQNQNSSVTNANCVFVGSKNSNKYHLPTCSFAKRIKDTNKVCFASEEDAKSKGYVPGCLK